MTQEKATKIDEAGQSEQKQEEASYFGMGATELAGLVQAFMANKDAAKQVVDIFKPVIGEVSDLALDTIGPEIYKVLLRISLANVAIRKEVFDAYVKAGFTDEQAFYLLVEDGNQGQKFGSVFNEVAKGTAKVVAKK